MTVCPSFISFESVIYQFWNYEYISSSEGWLNGNWVGWIFGCMRSTERYWEVTLGWMDIGLDGHWVGWTLGQMDIGLDVHWFRWTWSIGVLLGQSVRPFSQSDWSISQSTKVFIPWRSSRESIEILNNFITLINI